MKFDRRILKAALKSTVPILLGYFPTGFAFGLLLTSGGYDPVVALAMSLFIYAGAGQYLAIGLLQSGAAILQVAVMTFLINSKHLFYGLSLLDDYKGTGIKKPYMIFALTDEVYALLTSTPTFHGDERKTFCFYVSVMCQTYWFLSTALGAVAGSVLDFDARGMDFAMTAMFIVILMGQLKAFKTKAPFIIGTLSTICAMFLFGKSNMLLLGSIMSIILLILLRRFCEPEPAIAPDASTSTTPEIKTEVFTDDDRY